MTTPSVREVFPMNLFANRPRLGQTAAEAEGIVQPNQILVEPTTREVKDFRAKPVNVDDAMPPKAEVAKKQKDKEDKDKGGERGPKDKDSSATDSASPFGPDNSATGNSNTPVTSTPSPPRLPSEPPVSDAGAEKGAAQTSPTLSRPTLTGAVVQPAETTGEPPVVSPPQT
jgi:hypothetical protein